MRLCTRTAMAEQDLEQAVSLGVWGVALPLPSNTTVEQAREFGAGCARRGLVIAAVVGPEGALPDASGCSLAREVGARSLVVRPGAGTVAELAEGCRMLCDACSIRILAETTEGSPVGTLTAAAELVRSVARPNFGVALDPVGLLSLDTYFDNDSFLARVVQQLGAAIGLVVARDATLDPDGLSFRLVERVVGTGGVRYRALLAALRGTTEDLPVLVDRRVDAMAHIRGMIDEVPPQ